MCVCTGRRRIKLSQGSEFAFAMVRKALEGLSREIISLLIPKQMLCQKLDMGGKERNRGWMRWLSR